MVACARGSFHSLSPQGKSIRATGLEAGKQPLHDRGWMRSNLFLESIVDLVDHGINYIATQYFILLLTTSS